MKKIFWMFFLCLCLVGCGKNVDGNLPTETESQVVKDNSIENVENMAFSDFDFKSSADNSGNYWFETQHKIETTEKGNYIAFQKIVGTSPSAVVGFLEKGSDKVVALCNSPTCKHTSSDNCNALFLNASPAVYLYKDKLYLIEESSDPTLISCDLDGTNRKKLFGEFDTTAMCTVNPIFADDSVYFFPECPNNSKGISVIRKSLDGKEEEIITFTKDGNGFFKFPKLVGDNIIFTYHTYYLNQNGMWESKSLGLYCYDTKTKKLGKIIDKDVVQALYDNQTNCLFYYVYGEGLYKYDLNSDTEVMLNKAGDDNSMGLLFYDGKYLYMSNMLWANRVNVTARNCENKLFVMTIDGELVNEIKLDDYTTVYGSDGNKFYISKNNGGVQPGVGERDTYISDIIAYFDVDKINQIKEATDLEWN